MLTIKDEQGHSQIWKPTRGNRARAHWRIQRILEALPEKANVLELGCGYGDLTQALLAAGHSVTAIDQSTKMIHATKLRCHTSPALILHTGEITDYLFKNDVKFDGIVGIGILHHLAKNLPETLVLISQHTKPNGKALFWEPNRQNPIAKFIFGTIWGRKLFKLEPTEEAFSEEYLKKLATPYFSKAVVTPKDWAYPYLPENLLPCIRFVENRAPKMLKKYIAQSLWIELHKAHILVAKTESPK